ncbi:bifunctional phosphoribosyl-AMP cyclohydrolase/phosphoribosyl-ATP diphosphatase HisIE [Aeromonas veronii]|uniref:bifunctional phosphoribosyl-AMP cyclohydrolase/phosphoribosyl-ATP diphosphatase HisIE n=1 Tax=Aeromonas TaxID=642 RepID=UPI0018F16C0F|nr:bifunctional phosphoribosyl-AMP cyclohydrolase/phosphoribosyl-ATP diphosphatase HisIE [Aeromonas veronii]MBJ7581719.1 bifunctional phosphoribosyl-AMP cyclohydrolase/phosphoribosyl-ATP diphosphatase HisIE [Aeromonas veronii]MBL0453944.1 bifunctional phosphoribosyl-AMP cyclohydrolase/phosphoribosyl-ATP diphosphatase HisIE [Aeromonas veronii]MEB5667752.1 bifunctional phosphoribosyl-AMP cyclohydrolase/phosphoribosyl-ATP diphosphatase HisIE [Aeromonas veronii]HDX8427831.1 bifunctional phosphoribo
MNNFSENAQTTASARPLAEQLDWEKCDGMIPAIVQHAASGEVLMQGFMTREALEKTQTTGQVTFFSRSKQRLWTKGESSGNVLQLVAISTDCDQDSLLIAANPVGPTCHKGTTSCFNGHPLPPLGFLAELEQVLAARKGADPATSYTASLYGKGTKRIAQKVGEEGVEVALAAMAKDREELINESADLLYHLTVLLQNEGLVLKDVVQRLYERHNK